MQKNTYFNWKNPIIALVLGIAPLLIIATTAQASLIIGVLSACVMICSCIVMRLLRNAFSKQISFVAQLFVIATFVSIAHLILSAYFIQWSELFGIYIPLLAVNVFLLSQTYNAVNTEDSFGKMFMHDILMAILWIALLFLIGSIREIASMRTWFGIAIISETVDSLAVLGLPAGGLLLLGFIAALVQRLMPNKVLVAEIEKGENIL